MTSYIVTCGVSLITFITKAQNGHNPPKWNQRAPLGQFLGFSDEHSFLVANVRHLRTGYISPHFHLAFDDLFETVIVWDSMTVQLKQSAVISLISIKIGMPKISLTMLEISFIRQHPINYVWLDERGRHDWKQELARQKKHKEDRLRKRNQVIPEIILLNKKNDDHFPQ